MMRSEGAPEMRSVEQYSGTIACAVRDVHELTEENARLRAELADVRAELAWLQGGQP